MGTSRDTHAPDTALLDTERPPQALLVLSEWIVLMIVRFHVFFRRRRMKVGPALSILYCSAVGLDPGG